MKIELESVEISALRDFGVNQSIKLPKNQVVSVVGENLDDGGSNGTGKSTFAMATAINLFGAKSSGISSASLKNRYLNTPTRIMNTYTVNGETLIVDRTIGGKFTFKLGDNKWVDGKTEDVQNKLNEILGITEDQFDTLSNKPQGAYGGFLLKKDSDKKDFLSSFFEVNFLDTAQTASSLQLKQKEKDLAVVDYKQKESASAIARTASELEAKKNELQRYESEEFKKSIQALETQKNNFQQYLESLDQITSTAESTAQYINALPNIVTLNKELESLEAQTVANRTSAEEAIKSAETELALLEATLSGPISAPEALIKARDTVNAKIQNANAARTAAVGVSTKLTKIDWEMSSLREQFNNTDSATCNSCGTKLSEEKIASMKSAIADKLKPLMESKTKLTEEFSAYEILDEAAMAALEKEKSEANASIISYLQLNSQDALKKTIADLKSKISSHKTSIISGNMLLESKKRSLSLETDSAKSALELKKSDLKANISTVLKNMVEQLENKTRVEKSIVEIETKMAELKSSAALFESDAKAISEEIEVLNHVDRITSNNGFVSYLFDSILEDINSEINLNLKMIPNARKFSLQFASDKIAKTTGAVSKSITYQIFSGKDEVEFNTLSGGEKLSIIISVDEALDTVLSRRLGVSIGWKFLDEQFGWIDENSKEAILEFYKAKSANKTYFIIDHASEFNAALDAKIHIVKQNGIAKFTEAS